MFTLPRALVTSFALVLVVHVAAAQVATEKPLDKTWVQDHYAKREVMVPMRDGVKLFTSIYTPKDTTTKHPILLRRTPYSCNPYGADKFPSDIGPSALFTEKGYALVVQDVRGCYMSEGKFVDMRPQIDDKKGPKDIDESSDSFDTIDWLVKNVENNNGRVGMWGISYPGFYSSAGMIDAHPALKAVSPQAPIADWWYDDFHHHGALFLPHAFNFLYGFGQPRPEPTKERKFTLDHGTPDGYRFFMDLGPLANVNAKWFHGEVAMWNDIVAHPNYDEYWQARNLLPHLKHVAPAVMTVGGWFDAEDLYGALKTYRAIEAQNPGIFNVLVMGPWQHGGWARTDGDRLGNARFGAKTSLHYRKDMELAFFEHFLKDFDVPLPAEANVFDTGKNEWRTFDAWPPNECHPYKLGLDPEHKWVVLGAGDVGIPTYAEFVSDPAHPVPFTESITTSMTKEYMTDDQRFASRRSDVLTFESYPLVRDLTVAGPILADLVVSTSGTDSDWIVKLIDVFPDDAPDPKGDEGLPANEHMAGYQMLVRSEVGRGRFRNNPARPEPFEPNWKTEFNLELLDVLHTFKPGHRIMVQIQSTWFPLVDRNPQQYVESVYTARVEDFKQATHRVYGSTLMLSVLSDKSK